MRRFLLRLLVLTAALFVLISSGVAYASSTDVVITPRADWVNVLIGSVLPALVALVTARVASDAVKTWTLALLSAITAVAVAFQQNGSLTLGTVLSGFAVTFLTAVVSHYTLLKPGAITGSQGVVQRTLVPGGVGGGAAPAPGA